MKVLKGIKALVGRVKSNSNTRYIEVDGVRYAVGIDYIIELTKQYNRKYGVDAGIDEVLVACFGNAKVTVGAIDNIVLGLMVSINVYNSNDKPVNEAFVKELIDSKGFAHVGRATLAIASTLTALMVAGNDVEKESLKEGEQKKS